MNAHDNLPAWVMAWTDSPAEARALAWLVAHVGADVVPLDAALDAAARAGIPRRVAELHARAHFRSLGHGRYIAARHRLRSDATEATATIERPMP